MTELKKAMIVLDGNCNGTGVAAAQGKAGSQQGGLTVPKVRRGPAVLGVGKEIWGGAPNSEADCFLVTYKPGLWVDCPRTKTK